MIHTVKHIYNAVMRWGNAIIEQNPRRASIVLMILSGIGFSSMGATIMTTMQIGYHPAQVSFFRGVMGTLLCLPICIAIYKQSHSWRCIIAKNKIAMMGRFFGAGAAFLASTYALYHITIAEFTAMSFMIPICLTIAGALVFGESVGIRRISAVLIGFLGVYIIINPQSGGMSVGHIFAIGFLFFGAITTIFGKILSREIPTTLNVIYITVGIMVVGGITAIPHWQPITINAVLLAIMMGLFGHIGQWALTKSMEVGELSVIMSLDYLRLFYGTFYGFVLFGQIPPENMWWGSVLIIGAALYTSMRQRAKKENAP